MSKAACRDHHVLVEQCDAAWCCPPTDQDLVMAHPRVYLPLAEAHRVVCPYCSTIYVLAGTEAAQAEALVAPQAS